MRIKASNLSPFYNAKLSTVVLWILKKPLTQYLEMVSGKGSIFWEYHQSSVLVLYRIYERVLCHLKGRDGMSQVFDSNMGVKQECPLSPTLFGLCIDKLEEILHMIMEEGGAKHPQIGTFVIVLLLYADDVVFFTYTVERMQEFMGILECFCKDSGLTVNVPKTKMMG